MLFTAPAFAGIFDGLPADPEKRARPGGYNEQAASLKSLAEWEEKVPQWCAEGQTPEEDDCVDTDL